MNHDLKSIVGARIKAARKAAGLTQAQLAEAIDRTVEAISNIERGRSLPPLDLLGRIAGEINCPLSALVDMSAYERASPERAALEIRILAAGKALPIEQLRIAVVQIEALRSRE